MAADILVRPPDPADPAVSVPRHVPVWPGAPYPLGRDLGRTRRQLRDCSRSTRPVSSSASSTRPRPTRESRRLALPERPTWCGTATCPSCVPGSSTATGSTVRTSPSAGHRFNPAKIVLDPYAKAIGRMRAAGATRDTSATDRRSRRRPVVRRPRQRRAGAPLAVVVDPAFTWGDDRPPRTPWHETVIYELHRQGLHAPAPGVPEALRGTLRRRSRPTPALEHLTGLGVTAVELMPVHHHIDDRHLVDRGLSNYWGYNTLCFLSPDQRYTASTDAGRVRCASSRRMVRALHAAGIEVILDVVYNHTGEGQPPRSDAVAARHRQRHLLPARARRTRATTSTSPAAATRST